MDPDNTTQQPVPELPPGGEDLPEVVVGTDQSGTAPVGDEGTLPEDAPKSFTQEEVDAIVAKRLAREKRNFERQRQQSSEPNRPVSALKADDFDTTEAYVDALATERAQRIVGDQRQRQQSEAVLEGYHEREETAREKYADFEQVAYNPNLPITDVMAEIIRTSDAGPDLIYHLGQNPKEAARISKLAPFLQAKEIGVIEAKLASTPPVRKVTSTNPPINPIAARTSGNPSFDTTDPRSIAAMSTSEWIKAERARQVKKASASH